MRKGYLSEYFIGSAAKRLSAVEASLHRSNQHEFNGVSDLKVLFGNSKCSFKTTFIYLSDDDPEPILDSGFLTWYDARENHPTRSEFRMYYSSTTVSANFNEGDMFLVGLRPDNSVLAIVAESGSTIENQILWLFGISDLDHPGYTVKGEIESNQIKLEFASRYILEQIGIETEETNDNFLDEMLTRFGKKFPKTQDFSEFARSTVSEISAGDNPDEVIMAWMEREEVLFRTLEKHLVGDRLAQGFAADDVDEFIRYSLSVQNRRKSRAGHALENHLEYLFRTRRILCDRSAITERRARPDFLFPGRIYYINDTFPVAGLTMLGVKSTCKDRWRQILAEADRIPHKHLLTLEPGISENQTDEMTAQNVQLVIPERLFNTFTPRQHKKLSNIKNFLQLVKERQKIITND